MPGLPRALSGPVDAGPPAREPPMIAGDGSALSTCARVPALSRPVEGATLHLLVLDASEWACDPRSRVPGWSVMREGGKVLAARLEGVDGLWRPLAIARGKA